MTLLRCAPQAAEHAGSQRRIRSLPRATPEEIAEARRAAGNVSEPSSPTSPAAQAAADVEARAAEEDRKAEAVAEAATAVASGAPNPQPPSPRRPSDISLTLKGWAAANAVSAIQYSHQPHLYSGKSTAASVVHNVFTALFEQPSTAERLNCPPVRVVGLQVQTPDEEDGTSTPHADSPGLSPRLEVRC